MEVLRNGFFFPPQIFLRIEAKITYSAGKWNVASHILQLDFFKPREPCINQGDVPVPQWKGSLDPFQINEVLIELPANGNTTKSRKLHCSSFPYFPSVLSDPKMVQFPPFLAKPLLHVWKCSVQLFHATEVTSVKLKNPPRCHRRFSTQPCSHAGLRGNHTLPSNTKNCCQKTPNRTNHWDF